MTLNPWSLPPVGASGLTRLQLHMMEQRISQRVLSEMTAIPAPTISQYCLGVRSISKRHLPLLATCLGLTHPQLLAGYATPDECPVLPNEWTDDNPFGFRRNYTSPHYLPR